MAQTYKFGNGTWATKKGSTLAYSDTNNAFKPLPFNFTRDSIATRVNKEGLIEVVGNDIPRIDYTDSTEGALLLENSTTNLVTYSEALSNWTQDGASTVDNSTISPDGTQNASKINFNSGNERIYVLFATSNTSYSGYFKGIKGQKIKFIDNTGLVFAEITLTEKWVRHEFYKSANNTNIQIQSIDANYVYAWGIQAEQNSVASSYIPTNSSTVQRAAETCNGSGNSEVFNDSQGVLFADIAALSNDGTNRMMSLSNGGTSNRIVIKYDNSSNRLEFFAYSGGSPQYSFITTSLIATEYNKISFKYKLNDFSVWSNGFELDNNISGTTPIGLNQLRFDYGDGNIPFYGNTKEIAYYDEILTDAELETLTSYRSLNEMVTELNLNAL